MAHQGHGLRMLMACVCLSAVPPYHICHHPQMWSWSSLQDVKPSGKWEKIPFHTAADASAQMFLNWATFFGGGKGLLNSFLVTAIAIIVAPYMNFSVIANTSILPYITTPITGCILEQPHKACVCASYSSQPAFAYGFFFARWHFHTISSLDDFCKRGGAFSASNSQHDWGFNVGEASAKPVKVWRPQAI